MTIRIFRRPIREMTIEGLLHWTFGVQFAQLERSGDVGDVWNYVSAHGTEWTIYMRHLLGGKVDGGRGYFPDPVHDDAEAVAAVVSGTLDRRMAIWVVELAVASLRPDWMPSAVPLCVPRIKRKANQHGAKAGTVPAYPSLFSGGWGATLPNRKGNRVRTFHCEVCPVVYEPTRQHIDSARDAYVEWWDAVDEVRDRLIQSGVLREHRIVGAMPPREPWLATGAKKRGLAAMGLLQEREPV